MTPEEYNDLYSESFNKQMRIVVEDTDVVITNPNICSETMSINESLNSDVNLKFGSCESSCFQIRVANIESSLKGKWLDVNMDVAARILPEKWITENGEYVVDETDDELMFGEMIDAHSISLGRYKVKDDVPTNDRCWRDLTCFDVMYDILNADVSGWFESLTFPMTIKNFRDSFFTYLDIEQVETTLINDSFVTQGGFVVDGQLAGKTVINAICELNGCFGHITTDGKFDYVYIPNGDSVTLNWYIDGSGSYEDYTVQKITGIIARAEDEDVGTTVGTTVNPYIIENNPLIYGSEGSGLTNALTNILNAVKDITYRPFKVRTYGNPMLKLGTTITINTKNKTINSIIINKYMKGIQALTDTFSAEGEEYVPSKVNSTQSQVKRTMGKVHKLINTVDEMSSEIYEVDPQTGIKTSKISQLSNEIVMKVDVNGNIVQARLTADASTGSSFEINADTLKFKANKTLDLTTSTLNIESTNFKVDYTGNVEAKNFTVDVDYNGTSNAFRLVGDNDKLLGSWGNNGGIDIITYSRTSPEAAVTYGVHFCDFICKNIYENTNVGNHEEKMIFNRYGLALNLLTDPFQANPDDRLDTLRIQGYANASKNYIDIINTSGWGIGSNSLRYSIERIKDLIKVKYFYIDCSNMTNGMSLSSHVFLDTGYKFFCFLPTGASTNWIADFPIYLNVPDSINSSVFWNGTLTTSSDCSVRFTYLEIRDI